MIYTEPLFLGVTPTGARNYVADKVVSLERPFFNACAGRFSVVEAAIKAGVPRQNVFASDIGLFSSIIGFLADPSKNLDDLGIRILDPTLEPKGIADKLEFADFAPLQFFRNMFVKGWDTLLESIREQRSKALAIA